MEREFPFVYKNMISNSDCVRTMAQKEYVLLFSTVFEDIDYLWHGWNTLPQGSTRHEEISKEGDADSKENLYCHLT
jgi:hypothetical protein